ncbi:IDEAL domain-containing protein [Cohnella nanjingensis]|uniref:IDEAL domain-containing protein n=2 Tax=Cohnella nanjingensis TaxID=1387779 RepID=A0A7X0RPV0_9BACL|nr:IDEAL domain-containing protein [Cohnella nanjingensis]
MNFEIGDWVMGHTGEGELVQGFVERVNVLQGTLGIHVVASDHEEAVGRAIDVRERGTKKMPEFAFDRAEPILSMIDLALMTHDEHWFNELSGKLRDIRSASGSAEEASNVPASVRNRLGTCSLR